MAQMLQPLQIGPLNLPNRLVMPPMATSNAQMDGKVSPEILSYYKEKSNGGYIGLIIIEHSYISPEGKASNHQLSIADDSVVEDLKNLADLIHQNGTKAVMQINHAGSASPVEVIGTVPLGPSPVANPRKGGIIPRELTVQEIKGIVRAFRDAARRVKDADFDGVEIHSAHGYLLNQFLSPLTNQRTDDYGGDLNGRIRIHLEVIRAIRSEVGKDYPIFLRLGASDYQVGGTTLEDSVAAAQAFVEEGVNLIDISGGFNGYINPNNDPAIQGYFAPLSDTIRKAIPVPVLLTGGVTDPKIAEQLLVDGKADLIGVGRAILHDSSWSKWAVSNFT